MNTKITKSNTKHNQNQYKKIHKSRHAELIMTACHAELITTAGHAKLITTAWRANCLRQPGMTILMCSILFVMIAMVAGVDYGDLGVEFGNGWC